LRPFSWLPNSSPSKTLTIDHRRHRCRLQTASVFSLPLFFARFTSLSLSNLFGLRPSLRWSDYRCAHQGGAAPPPSRFLAGWLPPPPLSLSLGVGVVAWVENHPSSSCFSAVKERGLAPILFYFFDCFGQLFNQLKSLVQS